MQNNEQKPESNTRSKSRDIDKNDIVQWLVETFGIFRRLAAEWRHIEFVYDVIANMAGGNKRQRRFEPSQETGVKKMINCIGRRIDFIIIYECVKSCKLYPKLRLASGFTLTKSTRTITLQDVQLYNVTSACQYATAEVTISVWKYPEIIKISHFKRHFLENG